MGGRLAETVLAWTCVVLAVISSASFIFYTCNNCRFSTDASLMACADESWVYLLGLVSLLFAGIAVIGLAMALSCWPSGHTKTSHRTGYLSEPTYIGQPDVGVLPTTDYSGRPASDPGRYNDRPDVDPGRLNGLNTNLDIVIPRVYVYRNNGNARY
ncbi:uncharacterized protein [Procambarus clarkii]|uniref:uncharacterized protein n=1 Tax=Procambarus clarkii TaxID=6728 RepID=UPI001E673930|nr:uncharacterized protein LOC123751013 isoform X1 [Procambarus clarkii]XP_045589071.1 uncharacterized protein LOC123751013 isoform X1 [Procambarus clarkii]